MSEANNECFKLKYLANLILLLLFHTLESVFRIRIKIRIRISIGCAFDGRLDPDPYSFSKLDPDPHSLKKLDPDPSPQKVNADSTLV
jgi:hypothetical protein